MIEADHNPLDEAVDAIASRCTDVDSGDRNADNIMTNTLLPEMSRELLSRQARGEQIRQVKAGKDGEGCAYDIA